ncbi:uncharacterized protein LOC134820233 [Bolinopsis microptera]|uniref:uncharacterized protein LOC134820233 n=1 Tax=Bolinopsis microptera TaxID=2820187 RepID=UPI003079D46F
MSLVGAACVVVATISQLAILVLLYLAKTKTGWLFPTYIGTLTLSTFLMILRIFQVLSNRGILKQDNFYKRNAEVIRFTTILIGVLTVLASSVILGVFVYISYLFYLEEEHDVLHSYTYGYGVTLEVGVMEHVTVLTITVLGGVSVLGHVINTCLACCCHGDLAQ